MNYDVILERIICAVKKVAGLKCQVLPESSFRNELFFDPLDLAALLCRLEEQFRTAVFIEDLPARATVEDLAVLVSYRVEIQLQGETIVEQEEIELAEMQENSNSNLAQVPQYLQVAFIDNDKSGSFPSVSPPIMGLV